MTKFNILYEVQYNIIYLRYTFTFSEIYHSNLENIYTINIYNNIISFYITLKYCMINTDKLTNI
jgi:hypothetical protein